MGDRKHDIERYLRGELSAAEMHALEKAALNDPFLAEALEGIEHAGRENFLYDLHSIKRSVRDRVYSKSRKKGKVINIWGWTTAIAATVLLIVVSGFIVLSLLKQQAARQQALNSEPEPMPEEFAEKDTLVIMLPAEAKLRSAGSATKQGTTRRVPKPVISRDIATDQTTDSDKRVGQSIAELKNNDSTNSTPDEVSISESLALAEAQHQRSAEQAQSASKQAEGTREQLAAKRSADKRADDTGESLVVKGKVVDAQGQALPGVNVIVKNSSVGTVTDADGRFELSVSNANSDLVFAFIGYESQQLNVSNQQELNVALKEDVATLSEVVVTGYASSSDKQSTSTFRFAEPAGGRSDFKDYLAKSVQYPAEALRNKTEGRVTVRFTVQADGALTDFEVLKGIGSGCDEALIQAIKSGPAWKPSMQGDRAVVDKVKVRYRFSLPE